MLQVHSARDRWLHPMATLAARLQPGRHGFSRKGGSVRPSPSLPGHSLVRSRQAENSPSPEADRRAQTTRTDLSDLSSLISAQGRSGAGEPARKSARSLPGGITSIPEGIGFAVPISFAVPLLSTIPDFDLTAPGKSKPILKPPEIAEKAMPAVVQIIASSAPAPERPAGRPSAQSRERAPQGIQTYGEPTTGMEFVRVKGGCYEMGDTFGDGDPDERPVHQVCVNDFYLGQYEVTVGQFRQFVNATGYRTESEREGWAYALTDRGGAKVKDRNWKNPGFSQTDQHPVVCVSWNDASAFLDWLSKKMGKAFRLPTEAEWEYTARSGGQKVKYSWGNGSPSDNIADESIKRAYPKLVQKYWEGYDDTFVFTAPVGSFSPNELGLYDMGGNVAEWCQDWYGKDYYYRSSPKDNPSGPGSGEYRVFRGGSWGDGPGGVRAAGRGWVAPSNRVGGGGFRLVLPLP